MAAMPRPDATTKQRDMFTKRWRTVRAPSPKEHQIQIAIMEHFRWRKRPGVIGYHTPNGEHRDKRIGAKLRAMGTLPGVSDLTFLWGELIDGKMQPRALFLEVKAPGGKRSDAQVDFAVAVKACGYHAEVISSVDDGLNLLQAFGLLAR
jgi:hypothetical protein